MRANCMSKGPETESKRGRNQGKGSIAREECEGSCRGKQSEVSWEGRGVGEGFPGKCICVFKDEDSQSRREVGEVFLHRISAAWRVQE